MENKYLELFNREYSEADEAFEQIQKLQRGDDKPITVGYDFIDNDLIGGLNNKIVFIGSRPSMGKTYMSSQIQKHILNTFEDVDILRINLEMPTQSLLLRELKQALNKPMKEILKSGFTEEELEKAKETLNKFKDERITDFSKPLKGNELLELLRAFYISSKNKEKKTKKTRKRITIFDHIHIYPDKDSIDNVISICNDIKMSDPNSSFILFFQYNRTIEDAWRESKEKKQFNFNMLPSSRFIYQTDNLMQYADMVISVIIPQVVDLEVFASVYKDKNLHLKEHFHEESKDGRFVKLKGDNRIYYHFLKIRMNDYFDDPRLFCELLDKDKKDVVKEDTNTFNPPVFESMPTFEPNFDMKEAFG